MFDRHIEHEGLFPVLDELGIGCIVFSPLAQGLLTDRYLTASRPTRARPRADGSAPRTSTTTYLERARALNEIAQQRGQSLAQLALTWVLRQPA